MSKLQVAVLAGGQSSEHDISRLSAVAVLDALDRDKFEPVAVLIEKSGDWRLTSPERLRLTSSQPTKGAQTSEQSTSASSQGTTLTKTNSEVRPASITNPSNALRGIDVIFPVLHGSFGEDGTIQGMLESAGVPYVGNGVLASAVGMDKAIFKAVLRDAGIPVAAGIVAHSQRDDIDEVVAEAQRELSFPVFVKPARMGSSIGIGRASDEAELRAALTNAYEYDTKVLIESFVEGIEIECGVLGGYDPIVSVPGEVVLGDDAEWYDYETKYVEGQMELRIPARLSDEATSQVQQVALDVFAAIDCFGLARVDCFVTADGSVIVNEVNTMPGFTATSGYAKLFEASGHSYSDVVDQLINLAMDRHRETTELRH